jgi:hypothetical protein
LNRNGLNSDQRIQGQKRLSQRLGLVHFQFDCPFRVSNLTVQIAGLDDVPIDDSDSPDTGPSQVEASWTPETTGPNDQHRTGHYSLLSSDPDTRHQELSTVSFDLGFTQVVLHTGLYFQ